METLKKNLKTLVKPLVAIMLAIALLVASAVVVGSPVQSAVANESSGYAQYTWTNNAITATTTGTGKFTADYGQFECYETIDATLNQTVTLELEHSPNNVVWADGPVWQFDSNVLAVYGDFEDMSSDDTYFGIFVLYGQYTRPVITLGTSNPVTVTLRCIAKDTSYSINDEAGAIEATD